MSSLSLQASTARDLTEARKESRRPEYGVMPTRTSSRLASVEVLSAGGKKRGGCAVCPPPASAVGRCTLAPRILARTGMTLGYAAVLCTSSANASASASSATTTAVCQASPTARRPTLAQWMLERLVGVREVDANRAYGGYEHRGLHDTVSCSAMMLVDTASRELRVAQLTGKRCAAWMAA
jgi:hypothetical protein